MAASFCPKCGAPQLSGAQFCAKCGTAFAPAMAASAPTQPHSSAPSQKRGHGAAIAIAVVVIVILAIGVLYATGAFSNTSSPGNGNGSSPQPVTQSLVNTPSGTLGAGTNSAVVLPVSIPSGATAAEVLGWFNVTQCSAGGNCNAYLWIITPTNWANYKSGGSVLVVWCYTTSTTCSAVQDTAVDATGLSGYAGSALDLVMFNTDLTFSQTYSADISLVYTP